MSLLSTLRPKKGSTHSKRRIGRGDSSGWGGTAGKGHKGQKARAGNGKVALGFEGGQMPLVRRLPKFGFTNIKFKNKYNVVTLQQLNRFDGEVSLEDLKASGLVSRGKVKVIVKGELEKALQITVHKISASAKKIIEDKGGKVEVLECQK